ncbi:Glyoxalase/bleomycin resistance protein/dioxygenase [Kribbella flavida DSM 17836]|uniref:Glyoxalase/bleomycin resistance protein/dioxygenase n=1 Tax=Kribbella flavida (strain DSM 17836 / JCM 10339 / NBRC 14399) TaxID=479435 RepID=D2PZK3_KRIFD|nr:VOC family protein [Kribbella flavida]ADB35569.1 Glyoxalase/bleomycin resistance protein/dioxygenase [Kribbella flavida DSM 17836]
MTENSAGPAATLHMYFAYRDAVAALRWLEQAFGFETTMEFPDDKGGILHAEMRYGGVAFTVFSDEVGYDRPARKGDSVGSGAYVALASETAVDEMYASAVKAGAESVWTPDTTPWGNYRSRVADPEGYEWTFGTHVPGQPQTW